MKWISVDDELPEEKDVYLVYASSGDTDLPLIQRARWNGYDWLDVFPIWDITHWQHITQPEVEDAIDNTCDYR